MPLQLLGVVASGNYIAPTAFESIASATGTGSSSTITFSSIPSTYQHLQIKLMTRSNSGSGVTSSIGMRFNSDTGSNYTRHRLRGDGSTATAFGATSQTLARINDGSPDTSATANAMGVSIIDIHDYALTSKYKTVRALGGMDLNSVDGQILLMSSVWMNTNAITSISIFDINGYNFTTSTVAALYGIKGA